MSFRSGILYDARWIIFLLIASVAVLIGPLALCSNVTYNRWDNYEYYTAIIHRAHSSLLHGYLPRINPHQHLGEPIQSNVQSGIFYVPYTAAVAIQKLLGLPIDAIPTVIVATHLPVCMIGIYLLLRWIGVREWLAASSSVTISAGGFIITHAEVWAVTLPNFTWIAWIILGCMMVLDRKRAVAGGCLIAFGVPLLAAIGQGQLTCYAFLYLMVIIGIWIPVHFKSILPLFRLTPFVLTGILMSAPALLPIIRFIPQTSRAAGFTREQFLEASANPQSFAGLLSPLFDIANGFMSDRRTSIFMYQGAHVAPLLVAFVLIGFTMLNRKKADLLNGDEDSRLQVQFGVAVISASGLFALFALGSNGLLYNWTYGIPVWSSFRWPYKFLLLAVWGFGIVAAISGELLIRKAHRLSRIRLALPLICLFGIVVGLCWKRSDAFATASGQVALISGVLTLVLLTRIHLAWAPNVLVPVMVLSTVASAGISHDLNLRTYPDSYGAYTATTFGIDPDYRTLSLFKGPPQEYGLYHMATINGYFSLTGCTQTFIPRIFTHWIPSEDNGLPDPFWASAALPSNYLRSLNVRYLIIDNEKSARAVPAPGNQTVTWLPFLANAGYQPIKELKDVTIFASNNALPRAYFASRLIPFSVDGMKKGLGENQAPIDAAYIDGLVGEYPSIPRGQVLHQQIDQGGSVTLDIDAPQGGFLVLSLLHLPDWHASVDENPVQIRTVNGMVMGFDVPAGAKHIRFLYVSNGLTTGLRIGLIGFVLLVGWSFAVHLRQRSCTLANTVAT